MGGANISKGYIDVMKLGYVDEDDTVVVTRSFLQGGIVCVFYLGTLVECLTGGAVGDKFGRIKPIALERWLLLLGLRFNARHKTWTG